MSVVRKREKNGQFAEGKAVKPLRSLKSVPSAVDKPARGVTTYAQACEAAVGDWEPYDSAGEVGIERMLAVRDHVGEVRVTSYGFEASVRFTELQPEGVYGYSVVDSRSFQDFASAREWVDGWEQETVGVLGLELSRGVSS